MRNGQRVTKTASRVESGRSRRFVVLLSLALLAALALLLSSRPAESVVLSAGFPVAQTSGDQVSPSVGGDFVVFEERGAEEANIGAKDLSTGETFAVSSAPGDQRNPDTDGELVVFEDYGDGADGDVFAYDLASRTAFQVSASEAPQRRPSVDGGVVVWEEDRGSGWKLYGYDHASGQSFAVSESPGEKRRPAVSGDLVVWEHHAGAGESDVRAKRLLSGASPGSGEEFVVSASPAYEDTPQVSGSTVVWRENGPGNDDVYGRDLETGERFEVCVDPADQHSPQVSGKLAVWVDGRGSDADVYGKDLQTGEEFLVSGEESPEESPDISGETVVWEAQRTGQTNFGDWDVFGTTVDAAPSRPVNLTAVGTSGGVELSWSANSEADLAGYDVYRSSSPSGPFQKLNEAPLEAPGYTDGGAPRGEVSHYRVLALDARGQQSAFAQARSAALSETSLTFEASRTSIEFGGSIELSGRLTHQGTSGSDPVSGEEVSLEGRAPGSGEFRKLLTKSVSADGGFLFQNVSPSSDTEYRVRFEGNPSRGLRPSTSGSISVQVIKPTSITASVAPGVVPFGRATSVSGRLTSPSGGVAGRTVTLDALPFGGSGFVAASQTSTSADGSYSFAGLQPNRHTHYRVRFAGGSGLLPSASQAALARVRVVVSTNLSAARVRPGRTVAITGMVTPAHSGRVVVTVRGNGRVVSERLVSLSTTGVAPLNGSRYRFAYTPRRAGNYSVQVGFAGDADHLGAGGPVRSFVVR